MRSVRHRNRFANTQRSANIPRHYKNNTWNWKRPSFTITLLVSHAHTNTHTHTHTNIVWNQMHFLLPYRAKGSRTSSSWSRGLAGTSLVHNTVEYGLSHTTASVTKQYNFVIVEGRWCSEDSAVYQSTGFALWNFAIRHISRLFLVIIFIHNYR